MGLEFGNRPTVSKRTTSATLLTAACESGRSAEIARSEGRLRMSCYLHGQGGHMSDRCGQGEHEACVEQEEAKARGRGERGCGTRLGRDGEGRVASECGLDSYAGVVGVPGWRGLAGLYEGCV